MFGRVRSSPSSSLDSPEMLPSSKILKLDSLSIYEATLMRLKVGSQLKLASPTEQAEEIPNSVPTESLRSSRLLATSPDDRDTMIIDTYYSSASIGLNSGGCQSTSDLKQSRSRNGSITYLFSKYKSSQNALSSSYEQAAAMTDDDSAATSSLSSSNHQLRGGTQGQTEQGTFTSSVCQL
uniref:Uncharacterized protein n=1 Tax=Rhizophora mucronata TaxID=61149 RepID=A0A2P2QXD1_RHIMU